MPTPIPVYVIARPSGYIVQVEKITNLSRSAATALADDIAAAIYHRANQTADVVVVTE
jgi:hypothetical protein